MLLITAENISQYRSGFYPKVNDVVWKAGALDGSVLDRFPNIRSLDCSGNQLVSLYGIENCSLLQKLVCSNNRLTSLPEIECLPRLSRLYCKHNLITGLVIKDIRLLSTLYCSNNPLKSLWIDRCPRLKELVCSSCQLATLLTIKNCPLLESINLSNNRLVSLRLSGFQVRLKHIDCSHNKLATLDGIEDYPKLHSLRVGGNMLETLDIDIDCPQLVHLYAPNCRIKTLKGIERYAQLRYLDCQHNSLESLAGIELIPQLRFLNCHHNNLESLEGIERCLQLHSLCCEYNQIQSLEHLVYMRNISKLMYGNNPLAIQSPQVTRFLNRYERRHTNSSIYGDTQNVHDVTVQKTVCESVQRLLRDSRPVFSIQTIIESSLPEHTIRLLLEYCSDTCIHSVHLLTYFELLSYVWARVCKSEHKAELFRILGEQIMDAECMCFTGRFNRTLSVLVGFDPDIMIEISDNSRIGAIILAIKERMIHYDACSHKAQARVALIEAGYDTATIEPWLDAIETD